VLYLLLELLRLRSIAFIYSFQRLRRLVNRYRHVLYAIYLLVSELDKLLEVLVREVGEEDWLILLVAFRIQFCWRLSLRLLLCA